MSPSPDFSKCHSSNKMLRPLLIFKINGTTSVGQLQIIEKSVLILQSSIFDWKLCCLFSTKNYGAFRTETDQWQDQLAALLSPHLTCAWHLTCASPHSGCLPHEEQTQQPDSPSVDQDTQPHLQEDQVISNVLHYLSAFSIILFFAVLSAFYWKQVEQSVHRSQLLDKWWEF